MSSSDTTSANDAQVLSSGTKKVHVNLAPNKKVKAMLGALNTPSFDTSKVDDIVQQMLLDYTAWVRGEPIAWNVKKKEGLEKLHKLIATKEQEAYKAGMVKDATHRLTDAVDRMRRLDKDALKEFLKELKGDI